MRGSRRKFLWGLNPWKLRSEAPRQNMIDQSRSR